jgi:hypothetical protein
LAAEQIAAVQNGDGFSAVGCYVTLNPVNPALLARAANHLRVPKDGELTKDAEIVQRRMLLIDIDYVRPSGISTTDREHGLCHEKARQIRNHLNMFGFPDPMYGDSGNGAHLVYGIALANDVESTELLARSLEALHFRFSDDAVQIDTSVMNASRISKIYGTVVCKGDNTADRPHRLARLLDAPDAILNVSREVLNELVEELPLTPSRSTSISVLVPERSDVAKIVSIPKFGAEAPRSWRDGKLWKVQCPWRPTDGLSAYIIQHANGAVSAACLHRTCPGHKSSGNHWADLKRMYLPHAEPAPLDRLEPHCAITSLSQLPSVWSLESKLEWQIEGVVARSSISLIASESGTGKTWLAYFMAGCVAHGRPFIGRPVRQGRVLYIDGENPLFVVKQRLHDLGIQETENLTIWGHWNTAPPPGPDSPLVREFARIEGGLIIYDSLVEFHTGSEQSSTETRMFMRHFRGLANLGACVVILHNTGKAESAKLYRGSSDIKAAVDTAYVLKKASEGAGLDRLDLQCFKGRLTPGENFQMQFKRGHGFQQLAPDNTKLNVHDVIREILRTHPNSNQKQIVGLARTMGASKHQIEASLKNGSWNRKPGKGRETLYNLPEDEDEESSDPR